MDLVITILMSCAFNVTDYVPALSAGKPVTASCVGSYTDKASGRRFGSWKMALQLQRDTSTPDGLKAARQSYAVDVDPRLQVNMATLPDDTQAFVVKEVRSVLDRHGPALPDQPAQVPIGI